MNIEKLRQLWGAGEGHPVDVREILDMVCEFCDDIGSHQVYVDDLPYDTHSAAGMLWRLCAEALERLEPAQ